MLSRVVPTAVSLLALALVLLLANQARDLEDNLRDAQRRATYPYGGMYVPSFIAATIAGDSLSVGRGSRQVLFVFRTTCSFCRASIPLWQDIAASLADDAEVNIVGISLDSLGLTTAYASQHNLDFPVTHFPERRFEYLYRARSVPMTLVVEENGLVVFAKLGVLDQPAVRDSVIEAARYQSTTATPTVLGG